MNVQERSHFVGKLRSPIFALSCGYIFFFVTLIILWNLGIYQNNSFFRWGPPLVFFNYTVETQKEFYLLVFITFVHQLINNWISEVVYPWIINHIQDHKSIHLQYSRIVSILIVNLHAFYSSLDLAFIINGYLSQISFFAFILLSNLITSSIINWMYIKHKSLESDRIPLYS